MDLPFEAAYREERRQVVATMRDLERDDFEHGPTLCDGWAPRDVLAHLIGIDDGVPEYVRAGLRISRANGRIVANLRSWTRERLLDRADAWSERVAPLSRLAAGLYLGDCAIHHQDVLRPRGIERDIPEASRDAILREGAMLGIRTAARHRLVPTDGGRAFGRGREVRGTREALGMWLAGRPGIEDELSIAP